MTKTDKVLNALGLLAVAILFSYVQLLILMPVYKLTMVKHVGAPELTLFQLWAVSWFLSVANLGEHSGYENKDQGKLEKMITRIIALLALWGLTALFF